MRFSNPFRISSRAAQVVARAALVAITALIAACASPPVLKAQSEPLEDVAKLPVPAEGQVGQAQPDLPNEELTGALLYEFLVAEIALQRGNITLSTQAYTDLAKRTRDPRVAERATEIATEARMPESAIEAAKVWVETSPASIKPLGALSSLLVRANRLDEAEPYLQKLLANQSANRGDNFMQLNGLLANNPDKATNLRVIQQLAQPYPGLAKARFAVAQAAAAAGDEDLALKEVREAARLAPDWDLAALYEASLLQKTSNALAADRLAQFLKTYPKSGEVRLAYARTLVADKKYPQARGQFEQLLKDHPTNTDIVFAVAVLSMQLEDWPTAETNLKRLLELGYNDRNAVRL